MEQELQQQQQMKQGLQQLLVLGGNEQHTAGVATKLKHALNMVVVAVVVGYMLYPAYAMSKDAYNLPTEGAQ